MSDRRTFLRAGVVLAGAALTGVPAVAKAQDERDERGRWDDDVERRRPHRRLSPSELEEQMRSTARASRRFSDELHEALRRRRFRGERGEEAAEEAGKLDRQIHVALRKMEDREDRDEIRGNIGRCIEAARELDRAFTGRRLGEDLLGAWEQLIRRLNVLAVHYGFRRIRIDVDERER